MPEAIKYVVERIDRVQQVLQQPLIIENVSSYAAPGQQMTELEFTLEVLEQSQCRLLLDVNNVYVNSINHGYDAQEFIRSVPSHCIEYGHIAGHYVEDASLLIDTHGSDVCQSVWELLEYAYQQHGVFPTLLERDFNIPPLHELMVEVEHIRLIQQRVLSQQAQSAANA